MEELKKRLDAVIEKLTDKMYDGGKGVYLTKEVVKMLREVRAVVRDAKATTVTIERNIPIITVEPKGAFKQVLAELDLHRPSAKYEDMSVLERQQHRQDTNSALVESPVGYAFETRANGGVDPDRSGR